MRSEFSLRVLMFVILLSSSMFFAYVIFNTITEARRYERTREEIRAIRESQVQSQHNTEAILARGETRDMKIDEMISHIERNSEAIRNISETLRTSVLKADRSYRRFAIRPRRPRPMKTCTTVSWKVTRFGDKGERLIERVVTPVPCH